MNSKEIQRLLHRDCKAFSGGITSLAYALEKSPNILSNKLNVECEQNQLSFVEGLELLSIVRIRKRKNETVLIFIFSEGFFNEQKS